MKDVCGLVHLGTEVELVVGEDLDAPWHLLCSQVQLDKDGGQMP